MPHVETSGYDGWAAQLHAAEQPCNRDTCGICNPVAGEHLTGTTYAGPPPDPDKFWPPEGATSWE